MMTKTLVVAAAVLVLSIDAASALNCCIFSIKIFAASIPPNAFSLSPSMLTRYGSAWNGEYRLIFEICVVPLRMERPREFNVPSTA